MAEIDAAIEQWTQTRTVADVLATLGTARVPAGKVYTAKDIHEDPHYRAHDMILKQATRDGLQVEEAFVPTENKIALVNALSQAGMAKIEVTAFVSPQAIPALRDAEIVLREIERKPGVVYTCLVPNVRGAERAIEARTDELNLVMSASETHNLTNLRMTRDQSYAALSQVAALARNANVAASRACPTCPRPPRQACPNSTQPPGLRCSRRRTRRSRSSTS